MTWEFNILYIYINKLNGQLCTQSQSVANLLAALREFKVYLTYEFFTF